MDITEYIRRITPVRPENAVIVTNCSDNSLVGAAAALRSLLSDRLLLDGSLTLLDFDDLWVSVFNQPMDIHSFCGFSYRDYVDIGEYPIYPAIFYTAIHRKTGALTLLQICCKMDHQSERSLLLQLRVPQLLRRDDFINIFWVENVYVLVFSYK